MTKFKQGDTTTVLIELSDPLDGNRLKIGAYSEQGAQVYTTVYPDDPTVQQVDSLHYALQLPHDITMRFHGKIDFRFCLLNDDLTLVNAGETAVRTEWEIEPVNTNLSTI